MAMAGMPCIRVMENGVRCGVVWCGVVWCGVVWCGVVWCGVVWCGCPGGVLFLPPGLQNMSKNYRFGSTSSVPPLQRGIYHA